MTSPDRLIAFRVRMKWTQRLCARYLGVDLGTWLNWELEKHAPSADNARRLRAMLELAETEEGGRLLRAWARDAEARRAARRSGRTIGRRLRS